MNGNLLSIEEMLSIALLWKDGQLHVPSILMHTSQRKEAVINNLMLLKEMSPHTLEQYISMLRACLQANATWAKYEKRETFNRKRKCPF